jgi:L-alanine-DL-glutamate epimerase-like enolase superfamily enzyme
VIAEDVARVRAVREAVGPGVQLFVDANCSLDGYHALELARRLEPYDVTLFEEPVTQNDVRVMAGLRRKTRIPLGAAA